MINAQDETSAYTATALAKTGGEVPLFADGKAANSLYNPEREAEKAAARFELETFAVFAGLADGRRAMRFLAASPANECIIIEKSSATFSFLERLPAASAVMQSPRARLFSLEGGAQNAQGDDGGLKALILKAYLPALFRQFSLDILPSWRAHFPQQAAKITQEVEAALALVSADFSAQGLFGKLWHLNAIKNLYNAAKSVNLPSFSLKDFNLQGKKALVVAAGPSLDEVAAQIKAKRAELALFAADTALPALAKRGIKADFALSIDPQAVSARHFVNGLPQDGRTALIMDICASPAVAKMAWRRGCPVIFAAGGHPLAECMASFAPLPRLQTSAGTVTASAIDAARCFGFSNVATAGADFAYTAGKPYCRGTYLEEAYFAQCSRLSSAEGMYASLMFRGPVTKAQGKEGALTYKTELLESYKKAVKEMPPPTKEWGAEIEAAFPYKGFLFFYRDSLRALEKKLYIIEENASAAPFSNSLSKNERSALFSILPIAAYYRRKLPNAGRKIILKAAINLALNTADKYTTKL